jgi:DNA-binding NarL/FixJ family response regulator
MLTVEGLTARQIARRLVLSPRTVEHYIQGVRDRFELPNRATLVAFALSHEVMATIKDHNDFRSAARL